MAHQLLRSLLVLVLFIPLFSCSETTTNQQNASHNSPTTPASQTNALESAPALQAYNEGTHYYRVGEPRRNADGKIEVIEIFWFGCGHCYATEPYVKQWKKNKPEDVELTLVAAPFSGAWGFHAQVYNTNKALGIAEKVHQATYDAIHQKGMRLTSLDEVTSFYNKEFGVDPDEYEAAFRSFGVNVAINQAKELLTEYKIESVPNFIVGGAYRVNAQSAGSTAAIFQVIDYLIRNKM